MPLTTTQVAQKYGTSVQTAMRWATRDGCPHTIERLGKRPQYVFDENGLAEFLAKKPHLMPPPPSAKEIALYEHGFVERLIQKIRSLESHIATLEASNKMLATANKRLAGANK